MFQLIKVRYTHYQHASEHHHDGYQLHSFNRCVYSCWDLSSRYCIGNNCYKDTYTSWYTPIFESIQTTTSPHPLSQNKNPKGISENALLYQNHFDKDIQLGQSLKRYSRIVNSLCFHCMPQRSGIGSPNGRLKISLC